MRENKKDLRENMKKRILLMNDLPGYGKVALAAAFPILTRMGYHVYNLPTALVSNTLDWGKFHILDTTEYMEKSLQVWEELGFTFDAISTGFLTSEKQAGKIAEHCKQMRARGTQIFVDPIMGDVGKLYNGITDEKVRQMKKLVAVSDYIVPNYTEAVYLAGMEYQEEGLSKEEAALLVEKLRDNGADSVVVTSAKVDGETAVIAFDGKEKRLEILPFVEVPIRFPGTGDIFSAVFMGKVLSGESVVSSAVAAMKTIEIMIGKYQELPEAYKGIPIEMMLEELDL